MISIPDAAAPQIIGAFINGRYDKYLRYVFSQLQNIMLDGISDVLPLALNVAGAILVVALGWRLFRNFTRG